MENMLDTLELYRRKPLRHQEYISSGPTLQKIPIEREIIIKCTLEEMVKEFFKDFLVIWHDPDENSQKYLTELEKLYEIKTFTEWEKAVTFTQETKAACCHIVMSGINGELLVKEISSNQNVSQIYIYCEKKEPHSAWAKSYEKVLIETKFDDILDKIKESLLKWQRKSSSLKTTLPAFAPIFNDGDKTGINHLHRYLKVVPQFKNLQQAKNDFVNLSRSIYSDEKNKNWIDKFDNEYNTYNKANILSWYTQESFLYKVTNNCLRIATSDSIQYCRFLLKDLEQAIKEHYHRKSFAFSGLLYRGAYLSQEEWTSLKANINKDIEMHGFLSVSKSKSVALNFAEDDPTQKVFITILVLRGPDSEDQGFAEVHEFSEYPQEKEILFHPFTLPLSKRKLSKSQRK